MEVETERKDFEGAKFKKVNNLYELIIAISMNAEKASALSLTIVS